MAELTSMADQVSREPASISAVQTIGLMRHFGPVTAVNGFGTTILMTTHDVKEAGSRLSL